MNSNNPYAPPNSELDGVPGIAGMSIRYRLSRWDYVRGTISMILHMPVLQVFLALVVVWMGYLGWNNPKNAGLAESISLAIANGLVGLVLMLLLYWVMTAIIALFMKGRGLFGEHAMTIRDEGLAEETEYNITIHKWAGLHSIEKRGSFHYVYFVENTAHVVPGQDKVLEGDVVEFMRAAKTRIELARVGAARATTP